MVNVIESLNIKKRLLISHKRAIESNAARQVAQIDTQIEEIDNALETVQETLKEFLCQSCNGQGTIRRSDSAGQMEDIKCPVCNGKGVSLL